MYQRQGPLCQIATAYVNCSRVKPTIRTNHAFSMGRFYPPETATNSQDFPYIFTLY